MISEKVVCVTHADGTCTDVLLRSKGDTVQFEVNHWFLGPTSVEISKELAKLLLRELEDFIEQSRRT